MKLTNRQLEAITNHVSSRITSERTRMVREFTENHNFEANAVFAKAMLLAREAEELRNRIEGFLEENQLSSRLSTFSFLQYDSKEVEKLLKRHIAVMRLPVYGSYNISNELVIELINNTLDEAIEKIVNKYTKWNEQECNSEESSTTD